VAAWPHKVEFSSMAVSYLVAFGQTFAVAKTTAPSSIDGKIRDRRYRLFCNRWVGITQGFGRVQRQPEKCSGSLFENFALAVMTLATQMSFYSFDIWTDQAW
jgi:hypothetical protein